MGLKFSCKGLIEDKLPQYYITVINTGIVALFILVWLFAIMLYCNSYIRGKNKWFSFFPFVFYQVTACISIILLTHSPQ